MAKNSDKKKAWTFLSPENFVKKRARSLPLGKCYVSKGWRKKGLVTLVVTRDHPNGNYTFGLFLADLYCLGVKETFFVFNEQEKYHSFLKILEEEEGIEECSYALAHNIIYGSVAYAQDLGFMPAKEFSITKYILEEDDDKMELVDLKFGLEGKPAIFIHEEKNVNGIITILEKSVGPGGYTVIEE